MILYRFHTIGHTYSVCCYHIGINFLLEIIQVSLIVSFHSRVSGYIVIDRFNLRCYTQIHPTHDYLAFLFCCKRQLTLLIL